MALGVGVGGCQPWLCRVREPCVSSFSPAFTTSSPFSAPSFPVGKLEKTEHVSGVKQSKKRSQRKYSFVFVVKHLGMCTVFWETLCPKKPSLVDFYLYGASSPWV